MVDYNPEIIFQDESKIFESPFWTEDNKLFFVSIDDNLIYSLNLNSSTVNKTRTNGAVGCVVKVGENKLWSAEKEGLFETNLITNERKFLIQPEPNILMRYNDGKLDPKGRFVFGTKGFINEYPGKGKLYSYDGAILKIIITGTTISNGIAFSLDNKFMFFVDTPTKMVGRYHYNVDTGDASFDKYVINLPNEGLPDGICIDEFGNLWVAEWGGGKVCKWNPDTSEKMDEILFPVTNITSCCLGGMNNEYLFVTSARFESNEAQLSSVFKIKIR